MRNLIICVIIAPLLVGCGHKQAPLALGFAASTDIPKPSKTCLGKTQRPPDKTVNDDVTVAGAEAKRMAGQNGDGWDACKAYISRLSQGA